MPRFFGRLTALGVLVALVAIILDQGQKYWALAYLRMIEGQSFAVVDHFLNFTLKWNRGVSFGLLQQDSDIGLILLVTFRLLAAIFLLAWLARIDSRTGALAIGLIIGGAIGNVIDGALAISGLQYPEGFRREGVADFFNFDFTLNLFNKIDVAKILTGYVFNIADVAIVAGVALLLYDVVLNKEPRTHLS